MERLAFTVKSKLQLGKIFPPMVWVELDVESTISLVHHLTQSEDTVQAEHYTTEDTLITFYDTYAENGATKKG